MVIDIDKVIMSEGLRSFIKMFIIDNDYDYMTIGGLMRHTENC
jgi:hypothetical protein